MIGRHDSIAFLALLALLVDRECVSPRCLGVEMSTRTDGLPLGSHPCLATTRPPTARMIAPVIQADSSDARTLHHQNCPEHVGVAVGVKLSC